MRWNGWATAKTSAAGLAAPMLLAGRAAAHAPNPAASGLPEVADVRPGAGRPRIEEARDLDLAAGPVGPAATIPTFSPIALPALVLLPGAAVLAASSFFFPAREAPDRERGHRSA